MGCTVTIATSVYTLCRFSLVMAIKLLIVLISTIVFHFSFPGSLVYLLMIQVLKNSIPIKTKFGEKNSLVTMVMTPGFKCKYFGPTEHYIPCSP